jgi:hypothetical protein
VRKLYKFLRDLILSSEEVIKFLRDLILSSEEVIKIFDRADSFK